MPISLQHLQPLDWGRKLEYPEEAPGAQGEHTHTGRRKKKTLSTGIPFSHIRESRTRTRAQSLSSPAGGSTLALFFPNAIKSGSKKEELSYFLAVACGRR
ncbi:hypothetical protein PGIGA_G00024960 [Pangasianodon gigas]|uniref:Uncharacterized protein n=1 Tax=Pangasianodon gigas TaxID=30993 RepID=A0ACC5WX97_PANGG|nr:hypothetical protein [Pangasianodon gigas]